MNSRRRFLQQSLGSSALVSAGMTAPNFLLGAAQAAAGSKRSGENILVVVQLSGGNDGLNTVIPFRDPLYAKNRVVLRLATSQVLKINGDVGLHPQMTGFEALLKRRQLVVVQGVGYPNPNRSHFRSMDIWHSAQPASESPRDGWLGRSVDAWTEMRRELRDAPALHLGGQQLPLALASRGTAVPSVENVEQFRFRTDGGAVPLDSLRTLSESSRPDSGGLLDFVRRSTLGAYVSSEQVRQAVSTPSTGASYPPFALARKLQTIGQLIDAGLSTQIYYVSLNGFDTHSNQLAAHGTLLSEFAGAIDAFMKDMQQRGHADRVIVLGFSEFGRRVQENASQGTDHGTAGPVFLAGGKVKSGVIGDHPRLDDLDSEGDVKFHTDFRRIYASLLDRWLACDSNKVLGAKFEPLDLFV